MRKGKVMSNVEHMLRHFSDEQIAEVKENFTSTRDRLREELNEVERKLAFLAIEETRRAE